MSSGKEASPERMACETVREKEVAPTDEADGVPDTSQQVQAFSSFQELQPVLERLGIHNIPLDRLTEETSLEDAYIGGNVMAESTMDSSQGTVEMLLQDKSLVPEQKYITCHLQGCITRLLPESGYTGSKVYFHKAKARIVRSEFSQEVGMSIFVEGDKVKVWIVNANAGRPGFLPIGERQPNRRKAKRRRKANRLQMEERAREEAKAEAVVAASLRQARKPGGTPSGLACLGQARQPGGTPSGLACLRQARKPGGTPSGLSCTFKNG